MSTDIGQFVETKEFGGSLDLPVFDGWDVVKADFEVDTRFYAGVTVHFDTGNGDVEDKGLIFRKPAANVIVIRKGPNGDELRLVRLVRHGIGALSTELPGGMGKRGETPANTAAREGTEETGVDLDANALTYLGRFFRDPARSVNLYVDMFAVRVPDGVKTNESIDEEGEHIESSVWMSVSELEHKIRSGEVQDMTLVAAVGLLRVFGLVG